MYNNCDSIIAYLRAIVKFGIQEIPMFFYIVQKKYLFYSVNYFPIFFPLPTPSYFMGSLAIRRIF
jgi:hypothetical protein